MIDELILRAALRDELSRPLAGVRHELMATRMELDRLSTAGRSAPSGLTPLVGSLGGLQGSLRSVDSTLLSLSSSMRSAFAGAIRDTTYGVGALTAAAGFFGIKSAASFQQSRIAFGALLNDTERGNQLFSELQQYNLATPFNLPQVAQATQTLLQFGFAGDQVMGVLKSIGDVAATAADPSEALNRIAFAVGQIRTAGVLRAQDLNQLVQAGFPAYELVGKLSGLSGEQLRDSMQTGDLNVDAEQFITALTSMTGPLAGRKGAAALQNQTLLGQLSNFGDTIRMSLSESMQPLATFLQHELEPFSQTLEHLLDAIGPDINRVLELIIKGGERALPIVEPILAAMLHGVGDFMVALGGSLDELAPLGGDVGAAIGDLFVSLGDHAPEIAHALVDLVRVLPDLIGLFGDLVPFLDVIVRFLTFILDSDAGREIFAGLLIVLMGYSALSGIAKSVVTFAAALDVLSASRVRLAEAEALSGGGGIGGVGRAGRLARIARFGVGAIGGGVAISGAVNESQHGVSWGSAASTIGGAAAAGSVFGPFGAGAGALLGGAWTLGTWVGQRGQHPSAPAVRTPTQQVVNVPQGAIVVNNPSSDVDVERAFRTYFRNRVERAAVGDPGGP